MSFFENRGGYPGDTTLDSIFVACSRCQTTIKPSRTPKGGRFNPKHTLVKTDEITSKSIYRVETERTGCPHCGTPDWDGFAQPGSLSSIRW